MSRRVIIDICNICKKTKRIKTLNKQICETCYRNNFQPKQKCYVCKNVDVVHKKTPNPICLKCYKSNYSPPTHICSMCGKEDISNKKTSKGAVCLSCYDKFHKPKKTCCECYKIRVVKKHTKDGPVCGTCYTNYYAPKVLCVECNDLQPVNKISEFGPICRNCYRKNRPKRKCVSCKRVLKIATTKPNGPLCYNCYYKDRRTTDPLYNMLSRLRSLVRSAFTKYSKTGKIKTSKKYGINYEEIILSLYPCPGPLGEYHIDHIIPLCAFNLNDPIHVRAAFSPQNHRWLTVKDNLVKSGKYNVNDFNKLLKQYQNGTL